MYYLVFLVFISRFFKRKGKETEQKESPYNSSITWKWENNEKRLFLNKERGIFL